MAGIAITGTLFLASVTMPIISFFSSLFIPLPVMLYRLKLGRQSGMVVPSAMLVLIALILEALSPDFFLFSGLMIFGFFLGEFSESGYSIEKTILFACGLILAAGFAGLLFYSMARQVDIIQMVSAYVERNLVLTVSLYEKMGMPEENISLLNDALPRIQYALVRILPSLLISTALVVGWLNLLIARSILMKKGFDLFLGNAPLNKWQAPEKLVWGIIGSGLLLILTDGAPWLIGMNGLITCFTVYMFQGMAVTSFMFEKKKFPLVLKVLLYAIIALNQILLILLVGIGLFDVWLNFRKLSPAGKTEE
ncbi:MAG: YybS family protein [Proteobacteria bacterium]|nr:YybS family protein [Pseudomonadota bacterium]